MIGSPTGTQLVFILLFNKYPPKGKCPVIYPNYAVFSYFFKKSFDCCKLQKLLVLCFISAKALLLRIYSTIFVKFHSVYL